MRIVNFVLFLVLSSTGWCDSATNKLVVIEVSRELGAEVVLSKMTKDSVASHRRTHPASETIAGDEVHVKFHDTPEKQKLGHEGDMAHHVTHTRARSFDAHGWDPDSEEFSSGLEYHKHASIDAVLPPHVTSIVVEDMYLQASFVVAIPTFKQIRTSGSIHKRSTRSGHILEQEVLSPLSQSGPVETQQNLIFLSGGYLSSEKAKFIQHVNDVKKILFNSCDDCENAQHLNHSVSYKRYLSGFNVFAVWQSSPESGASIPTKSVKVNDNLDCSYGTVVERALFCSPAKIQALADTAPSGCINKKNVVAIVLVNSNMYGGAASYRETVRVGSFSISYFNLNDYAKERGTFASLFFHETGHCYADLMDEYDTQVSESKVIKYTNCHHSSTGEPWSAWVGYGNSLRNAIIGESDYYTVSTNPIAKCGWTNYFKPSENCFMEKLTIGGIVPRLCPVCREGTVFMFYRTGIDTTYPKCPLNSEKLYITPTGKHSGVYIFVNREFGTYSLALDGGPVGVTWKCGNSAATMATAPWSSTTVAGHFNVDEPAFVYVTAQWFADCRGSTSAPITVSVTFSDETYWVTPQMKTQFEAERRTAAGSNPVPENQKFSQTYSWTIEMVNDIATVNGNGTRTCKNSLPDRTKPSPALWDQIVAMDTAGTVSFDYVSQCQSADGCVTDYNFSKPFVAVVPSKKNAISDVEDLMKGPIGIGAAVFVFMFLVSWTCLSYRNAYRRAKSVYVTGADCWVGFFRKVIMFFGVFFMLCAIAGVVVILLQYDKVGSFLKLVLLAALLLCIMLFVMAYVGFTAAWFRAKWMLWINGLGLFFTLAIMVYTTYVVIYVGNHIEGPSCTPSPVDISNSTTNDISFISNCTIQDSDVAICGISGVGCELRELWKTLVDKSPEKVCAFQDELECSGYTQPCNRQPSSDYCPANCDPDSNLLYGDACKIKLQDDIKKGCEDITPIMIGLSVAMFLAMMNNIMLGCLIRSQHKQQRKEQNKCLRNYTDKARGGGAMVMAGTTNRALRLMRALDPEQRELMTRRFDQADRNKDGTLSKGEMRQFLRAVLSNKLTDAECAECFTKADTNKDNTISFAEFQELFNPGKNVEMGHKDPSNFAELYQRLEEPGHQAERTRGSSINSARKSPLNEPLVM